MIYSVREWNKAEAYHKEHYLKIGDKVTYCEDSYFERTNYNLTLDELKVHLNNLYEYECDSDDVTFTILGYKTHNKSGTFSHKKEELLDAINKSKFENRFDLIIDFKRLAEFARNPNADESLWEIENLMKRENTYFKGKILMSEHVEIMY